MELFTQFTRNDPNSRGRTPLLRSGPAFSGGPQRPATGMPSTPFVAEEARP